MHKLCHILFQLAQIQQNDYLQSPQTQQNDHEF